MSQSYRNMYYFSLLLKIRKSWKTEFEINMVFQMTDNLRSVIVFQLELEELDDKITGTKSVCVVVKKYFLRFFLLCSDIVRCRLSNRIEFQPRARLRGSKVSTFHIFHWSVVIPACLYRSLVGQTLHHCKSD